LCIFTFISPSRRIVGLSSSGFRSEHVKSLPDKDELGLGMEV